MQRQAKVVPSHKIKNCERKSASAKDKTEIAEIKGIVTTRQSTEIECQQVKAGFGGIRQSQGPFEKTSLPNNSPNYQTFNAN
jgi:hypothetical protein